MNIAIFASAFHPHVGGVEELVRQLARTYWSLGSNCIVITNRWPVDLPKQEVYEGIPVYRFAMRIPEGNAKVLLKYYVTQAQTQKKINAILKQHAIDILHIQCVSTNGLYALRAHQQLQLPLVVSTQGERTMDATQIYQRSAFLNQTLRNLLIVADYITACSKNTLDDVERYFGTPFGERAHVVYNGIELGDFRDAEKYQHHKPYILGIGRLVKQKGFDLLIEAFAQAGIDSHDLLLAGEGTERAALEELVRVKKLENRVLFVGRADRPTAVSLFAGCSFFVLPSRMEPQGIVNLEAMAAGKAVVGADVGGVGEIVLHNETGLLFPGEDVDALSQMLMRVASDETLRERLGEAGRERAQLFSWSHIANQYLEAYKSVLGKQSPSATQITTN